MAESQRARRAAAQLRHRGGLRAAPRVGGARCRAAGWSAVSLAGRVRRPRRRLHQVADLRGGVLARRRARAGQPERHLPARPDDHGGRHRRAEGPLPAADGAQREVWAQAWSEPDAGSDMASIRSQGRLSDDGNEWILNGQKIWASRAVWADWCFGIFRTDPESQRHKGLTFILIPLDTPGITVRPIAQLDGDTGFAEIFFDDVRVPVENTLGGVGRRLERGDGHRRLRARRQPAQPGPVQRRRRPPDRAVAASRRSRPTTRCATPSPTCGCRPRATACTPT